MKIGSIENWNPQPWLDKANILTAYDEPLMALRSLEDVPGYYRDHKDPQIEELRRKILSKLVTPHWYMNCHDTILGEEESKQMIQYTLRGSQMAKEVSRLNQEGVIPSVIEFAPGEFWLPIGMWANGLKFHYTPIGLSEKALSQFSEKYPQGGPATDFVIYCAFEIIEHLHFESDIRIEIERLGVRPDIIHMSTPLYSFDGRASSLDWSNKDLGHLRTYTPNEFAQVAMKMFHGYSWGLIPDQVMHLRGSLDVNK